MKMTSKIEIFTFYRVTFDFRLILQGLCQLALKAQFNPVLTFKFMKYMTFKKWLLGAEV